MTHVHVPHMKMCVHLSRDRVLFGSTRLTTFQLFKITIFKMVLTLSGGRRRPGPDGGLSALAVTLPEGCEGRLRDVQCRLMLRFLWTYLEELSNFDYDTSKKGAKG